jgi:histone H3/H4
MDDCRDDEDATEDTSDVKDDLRDSDEVKAMMAQFFTQQMLSVMNRNPGAIAIDQLPLARIKRIMKQDSCDPQPRQVSAETIPFMAYAAQLFTTCLTEMAWRLSTTRAKRNTLQVKDLKAAILASSRWDFLIDTVDMFDDEQLRSSEMSRQQRIAETKPASAALQPLVPQRAHASSSGMSDIPSRPLSFARQQHPGMVPFSSQLSDALEARREEERQEQELFADLRRATEAKQRGQQRLHESVVDAHRGLYRHPSLPNYGSVAPRVAAFPSPSILSQPIDFPPHLQLHPGMHHYSGYDEQQRFSPSTASPSPSHSAEPGDMATYMHMNTNMQLPPQLLPQQLLPPQLPARLPARLPSQPPPQLPPQLPPGAQHHVYNEQQRLAMLGSQLADSLLYGDGR